MNDTTDFLGLDVHVGSVTAVCVDAVHDAPVIDLGNVGTQQYAIGLLLKRASAEPVVVLNAIARRVIGSRSGTHGEFVFTYRELASSITALGSWMAQTGSAGRSWCSKGVHNLRHTEGLGRR